MNCKRCFVHSVRYKKCCNKGDRCLSFINRGGTHQYNACYVALIIDLCTSYIAFTVSTCVHNIHYTLYTVHTSVPKKIFSMTAHTTHNYENFQHFILSIVTFTTLNTHTIYSRIDSSTSHEYKLCKTMIIDTI